MAKSGVLQGLGATHPAPCYGRNPTLPDPGAQRLLGFSRDRPLDTPPGVVGFTVGDADTKC